jgi:hypothetical protein
MTDKQKRTFYTERIGCMRTAKPTTIIITAKVKGGQDE